MDFLPETELTEGHAEVIARGLMTVARADGAIHEREAAMIRSFLGDATSANSVLLSTLEKSPDLPPELAATSLPSEELASLFLKSCILLAYADGDYGPKERALIENYARAFRTEPARLGALEAAVKEFLMSQLAHLKNVDAAVQVAKKLQL